MAEAGTEGEVEADRPVELRLKCRKCRHALLEEPPRRVMGDKAGEEAGAAGVINIFEDQAPQWINDAVEEGNWTKGKLCCPGCSNRVGGFDFVGSGAASGSPVYLVRSKVDLSRPGGPPGETGTDVSSDDESNTESDPAEASRDSRESSSTDEGLVQRARKQKEKMRRKRRRGGQARARGGSEERDGSEEREGRGAREGRGPRDEESRREAVLRELLEGEPELGTVAEDVICPVCLDLLHEPFQVEPCGHIFCEPCLRRLGQKNPMNCNCPLCRTKIGFCKHLAATAREIREEHEQLYLRRKKFERSTPVFTYPLPWQPGWRNLLRGRPLGGNRFVIRDNRAEYLRAILHQIPFYIPPVMIANLINIGIFAFMMGFIEVFPNLLAIFFRSGNSSLPLNATLDSETSGDPLPGEGEAERGLEEEGGWSGGAEGEGAAGQVMDSTFYYVLFTLSVLAAALGQFLVNHELQGPLRVNRLTDLLLVVVITVLPLALLPAIMPYRTAEGTWFGGLIERSARFLFAHLNFHSAALVNETLIT